ncbi:hypothetical protein [Flavobacterium beibuense]|uniref:hypothetical protein n=1 Tax=Flavobacterium beibuense TaxID=657326 RepID=UPI003A9223E5
MCDIVLEDIGGESCEPVGGITAEVQIAPHGDFDTIVDPPATLEGYTDIEELVTIVGPHVPKEGKGFTKIQGVEETGTVKSTLIGNPGSGLFQNEVVITVAGSSPKLLGWLRLVKNLKFLAEVTEVGTGNMRQFGSKQFPAKFTGIEHAIEATMEGANQVTLTIQDKQKWPAAVYTGTLPMMPATP